MQYRRLGRNRRGRDLVIGDIHGHFERVHNELNRIGFDPTRDRLLCVGDLVDRGPHSERAADWLSQPWFHAVLGNHDASLLQRHGLLSMKFELWFDYHEWFESLPLDTRKALVARLAELPWALEVETSNGLVGIAHAEVPQRFQRWDEFTAALDDEEIQSLATSSRTLARQALSVDDPYAASAPPLGGVAWTIHGHTPRMDGRPGRLGNRLWIDTAGWYDRELADGASRFTIVDVDDPLTPL